MNWNEENVLRDGYIVDDYVSSSVRLNRVRDNQVFTLIKA